MFPDSTYNGPFKVDSHFPLTSVIFMLESGSLTFMGSVAISISLSCLVVSLGNILKFIDKIMNTLNIIIKIDNPTIADTKKETILDPKPLRVGIYLDFITAGSLEKSSIAGEAVP